MKANSRIVRTSSPPASSPKQSVQVRATAIGSNVARQDTSRQIAQEDIFTSIGSAAPLIPPYKPEFLYDCTERSNMLRPCISALVTNVGLSGMGVVKTEFAADIDKTEKEELLSFLESPNSEESFASIHGKIVDDYETYGYAFMEVVRDRTGRVSILRHMRAIDTRLMPKDDRAAPVTYTIRRGSREVPVIEYRAFRRFVQIVSGRFRYFKELGDPRDLNMVTGEYADQGTLPMDSAATEVLHIKQTSNEPYGVPRWINQLPSILGSREAEECNLRYFEDNTVPPMILSVAGGRLTKQSYRELRELLHKQGVGADRQNKILLIEAVPERESLEDRGTVSLRVDKLADTRQSDGLFKDYDEANQAKIRASFRLPPVAVGASQEQNFATARVSAYITESQVYLPLRNMFDEIYNKRLFNSPLGLGLKTCRVQSQVPLTSDPDTLIKSFTALNVMGALTPREANRLGNQVLQLDLTPYPEVGSEGWEPWMDAPILLATKGVSPDAAQNAKDAQTKSVEATGTVSPQQPENGNQ